jgi:hypothetical protein
MLEGVADSGGNYTLSPEATALKVSSSSEIDFILGIRPEHFQQKYFENDRSRDLPTIRAIVNIIYTFEKETFLDLNTVAQTLTAQLDGYS